MATPTISTTNPYQPFTEEHEMFRRSVRNFVEKELNPHIDQWEHDGIAPLHEIFKKMGDLGFLGLNYPETVGGANADIWFTVILNEEIGKTANAAGVPMAIGVQTGMATPALAKYGSPELQERYLMPAIRGDMVASIAVSEPDAGSDVARIKTRAVRDGEDYIINGSKMYITNGTQADWICLLARTGDGSGYKDMSLIIVPTNTPGFIVSKSLAKLGNWSSDTAVLTFENMRVPVTNRIGDEGKGFYYQMEQFQMERLIGAIAAVGGAERAVRDTMKYTQERQAFGKPLLQNQWIQFKLGELLTEIEATRQLCYYCAALVAEDETSFQVTRIASMCKLKAGRLVRQVADTCIQFYGGMGYMEETLISRYYRDARLTSIGGGADEIMLQIIAKLEGMDFK
jgi:citronellyl-CoA dehydrogenase